MIHITDHISIGDSADEEYSDIKKLGATLNVAIDLDATHKWCKDNIEYAQVGLIDGPGNELCTYAASVLCLAGMLRRHKNVLIYCHTGSRALTVSVMYLHATSGGGKAWPGDWSPTWHGWLESLNNKNLSSIPLPVPHKAHAVAFDKMDWRSIRELIKE